MQTTRRSSPIRNRRWGLCYGRVALAKPWWALPNKWAWSSDNSNYCPSFGEPKFNIKVQSKYAFSHRYYRQRQKPRGVWDGCVSHGCDYVALAIVEMALETVHWKKRNSTVCRVERAFGNENTQNRYTHTRTTIIQCILLGKPPHTLYISIMCTWKPFFCKFLQKRACDLQTIR